MKSTEGRLIEVYVRRGGIPLADGWLRFRAVGSVRSSDIRILTRDRRFIEERLIDSLKGLGSSYDNGRVKGG